MVIELVPKAERAYLGEGMGAKSRSADVVTDKGVVHIRTHCSPDFLEQLEMDEGIGIFAHYRSIIRDKEALKRVADLEDGNVVLAYGDDGKIVGYVAFSSPSPLERWGKDGAGPLYELGSIEVSRHWRRRGIAHKMVELAMGDEGVEDKILFLTGFSWHWDLEETGLSKIDYRKMLMRLFEPLGFRHFYTTEPNVNLDTANVLMVRIGARVSKEDRERFLDLAFATNGV